jgi:hypothetical protein
MFNLNETTWEAVASPNNLALFYVVTSSVIGESSGDGFTPDEAWGHASGNAGSPGTPDPSTDPIGGGFPTFGSSLQYIDGDNFNSSAATENVSLGLLWCSPTCYLAIWLQVVITQSDGVTTEVLSDTTTMIEMPAVSIGGYCLPNVATFNLFDPTTYNFYADLGSWTPGEPPLPATAESNATITYALNATKWSAVEGYTPPDDGSANGWPLAVS